MKKFLAIFLISIVACQAVEQDIDLEGFFSDLWDKVCDWGNSLWDWVTGGASDIKSWWLNIYNSLTGDIKVGWEWLAKSGYLEKILSIIKESGKAVAVGFCSPFLTPVVCTTLIGLIL